MLVRRSPTSPEASCCLVSFCTLSVSQWSNFNEIADERERRQTGVATLHSGRKLSPWWSTCQIDGEFENLAAIWKNWHAGGIACRSTGSSWASFLYVISRIFLCVLCCAPQVTTDKKSLAYVDNMLKKSNKKVEELHQELQELNAHIVVKDPEELLGNERRTQWTLTQQRTNRARRASLALYRIFPSVAKDNWIGSFAARSWFSTWIFGVQVVFPDFKPTLLFLSVQHRSPLETAQLCFST